MKELTHVVAGKYPIADAFAGTGYSAAVSSRNYKTVEFLMLRGVQDGATTSTLTVLAGSSIATPTAGATAVEFLYQVCTTGDTWGAITKAESTGFATTAGNSTMYRIFVDAAKLAEEGLEYCQLRWVESGDNPVVGAVVITMREPRFEKEVPETAIV